MSPNSIYFGSRVVSSPCVDTLGAKYILFGHMHPSGLDSLSPQTLNLLRLEINIGAYKYYFDGCLLYV